MEIEIGVEIVTQLSCCLTATNAENHVITRCSSRGLHGGGRETEPCAWTSHEQSAAGRAHPAGGIGGVGRRAALRKGREAGHQING